MSLKTRRLAYITFIVIFLILAAILIPYSNGYRYDFKKNKIVKIGSLALSSTPKNGLIYINQKTRLIDFNQLSRALIKILTTGELKERTPTILNLLPDEYSVEVFKEGFYPWKKSVAVQSQTVTFANKILLFLKNPPVTPLVLKNIVSSYASPDNGKIAYVLNPDSENKQTIELMDAESEKISVLYRSPAAVKEIQWSLSGKKILVTEESADTGINYLIINTEKPEEMTSLGSFYSDKQANLSNVKWDLENDNLLYGNNPNAVYRIDLFNREVKPVFYVSISSKIADYLIKNEAIYYLEKMQNKYFLKKKLWQKTNENNVLYVMEIPPSDEYRFFDEPLKKQSLISFLDKKNEILFLIDTDIGDKPKSILLKAEAKGAEWSSDYAKLLFYNDFELWLFDLEKNQGEILSRYGKTIRKAVWYPGEDYVILAFDDTVKFIEENGIDRRNTGEIVSIGQFENMAMGKNKPSFLYFAGKINNQDGLFKISLR